MTLLFFYRQTGASNYSTTPPIGTRQFNSQHDWMRVRIIKKKSCKQSDVDSSPKTTLADLIRIFPGTDQGNKNQLKPALKNISFVRRS